MDITLFHNDLSMVLRESLHFIDSVNYVEHH